MSDITLTQWAHMIQYYAPTTIQYLLFSLVMLVAIYLTMRMCRRHHEKWMHLHGDKALGDRIVGLQFELQEAKNEILRLETRNENLRAQIKAGIKQSGKVRDQQSQLLSILTMAGQ